MRTPRFSHQYLIAVTVETDEPDPDLVPVDQLTASVARRLEDIILHDRGEAFLHNDTVALD